jgi:hypothetical protein
VRSNSTEWPSTGELKSDPPSDTPVLASAIGMSPSASTSPPASALQPSPSPTPISMSKNGSYSNLNSAIMNGANSSVINADVMVNSSTLSSITPSGSSKKKEKVKLIEDDDVKGKIYSLN